MSRPSVGIFGAARLVMGGCAAVALAGCGFTPLYATPGTTPALASVEVTAPQTREGYLVKQRLNEALARDRDVAPLYRLAMTFNEARYPEGVRVNNVATRYELGLTASYVLTDSATGRVLLQSSVPVQVSYDSADPPFAGTQANQDGEVRLAEQTALRIRLDLARYFERQATPQAASSIAASAVDAAPHPAAQPLTPPQSSDPLGGPQPNSP